MGLIYIDENELTEIYIRLGTIHLRNAYSLPHNIPLISKVTKDVNNIDEDFARIAKNMYLKACALCPSSQSWLGAGKACFALKEYTEAEDAFSVRIDIELILLITIKRRPMF